ncbi:MAG: metallophosphoesterase [Hoeflea sp.]|uniref:metallophosphoesterase n=1 Tax=Hoeflea sp. TaxID=1940281 RepID=UPI0032EFEACB
MSLTYAIGDVHGRHDLLNALLAEIRGDAGTRDFRVVFLGDLIDRGPESAACVDLAIATLGAHPGSKLVLGNHEEFLLTFLDAGNRTDREAAMGRWLPNGGAETLRSCGFSDICDADEVARQLARTHAGQIAALRSSSWMVETESHVFVHGGIDPDLPLADQDPVTTRWIRDKFLHHGGPLPKTVVHGHTITRSALPEIHSNRIALDTGAVMTGHLTCGVFDGNAPPRFLATDDHGREIAVTEIRPLDLR